LQHIATAGALSLPRSAAEENAKRQTRHDFKAEYVQIAANKGNTEVLRQLLADYEIPWTAAQVGGYVVKSNRVAQVYAWCATTGRQQQPSGHVSNGLPTVTNIWCVPHCC
jgi:hypothetical protein